jgi:hypothetical protein
MEKELLAGLITAVLVAVALGLMWLGWRNRLRRQTGIEALPAVPAGLGEPLVGGGPVCGLHHRG